jgi:hypothetical protein
LVSSGRIGDAKGGRAQTLRLSAQLGGFGHAPQSAASRRRGSVNRRSRPQRWNEAVAELLGLQAEYATWLGALPDSLRDSATAQALQDIVDLDLAALADIQPPRGYGRD